VVTTIRLYYDAFIAVAIMAVVAIICGFIAAVIAGDSSPSLFVAAIAFLLTGAFWFLRIWRNSRKSALPPLDLVSLPDKLS
jgi:fructose-specific phosphotransferase system IIC component